MFSGVQTYFDNVQWVNGVVPPFVGGTFGTWAYRASKIPVYNKTLCMIGDSIYVWKNAGQLRSLMRESGLPYDFIGNNTDTMGYQHSAVAGDTTWGVINRLATIPFSDSYNILIGINDYSLLSTVPVDAFNNILRIVQILKSKSPLSQINICTLLPTTAAAADVFVQGVNALITTYPNWPSNVSIIDLGGYIRSVPSWQTAVLLADGLHPSLAGYQLIALYLTENIL